MLRAGNLVVVDQDALGAEVARPTRGRSTQRQGYIFNTVASGLL
jgi:hypothetical protein